MPVLLSLVAWPAVHTSGSEELCRERLFANYTIDKAYPPAAILYDYDDILTAQDCFRECCLLEMGGYCYST